MVAPLLAVLPPDLRERVLRSAREHGRAVELELTVLLEQALGSRPKPPLGAIEPIQGAVPLTGEMLEHAIHRRRNERAHELPWPPVPIRLASPISRESVREAIQEGRE